MSSGYDEGPVYYREIQKNAYLKRIPNDVNSSKIRPLGHKKPPLKPMWTLFCVHNGRTPFLEQYPEPDSPATLAHRPAWRACLRSARHVTASVKPHVGAEYDFLVDTDHGPVRMLAPDWESMQDWVSILRAKLHELRIVSRGENVYGAPPVAPPARAAARDPTSPLPPTPPVPPDRVPGIDLTPITRPTLETNESTRENSTPTPQPPTPPASQPVPEIPPTPTSLNPQDITTSTTQTFPNTSSLTNVTSLTNLSSQDTEVDISNWEPFSLPSTSRDNEPKKGVAKICGQNICLDDSLFKRNVTDSDEEFFNEIDQINDSDSFDFKQRVVVNNGDHLNNGESAPQRSNVTVIQVSNKGPPHTAIPVLGPETDVFDFEFKQNLRITPQENKTNFVNIVNTETTSDNSYGTVFDNPNSEYGHISLTTTVSLTGQDVSPAVNTDVNVTAVNGDRDVTVNSDGLYERLCLASTSNVTASPLSIRRIKAEKVRKSSLPNLDHVESDYECLFPNSSQSGNTVSQTSATSSTQNGRIHEVSRNVDSVSRGLRSNVERSQSQNAYDIAPRQSARRDPNSSPKRETKTEKPEMSQPKPIWKRGLTELSLLSRLRGIAQIKRQESPTRQEEEQPVTSPAKVVHRSRPVGRVDSLRRRSNSLTNCVVPTAPSLQPLRARQAAALRAEQRRGACVATAVLTRDAPLLCEYERQVWVARWGGASGGARVCGRAGDRVAALGGVPAHSLAHARGLLKHARGRVDLLFHRVPLAKIYLINKREDESLGIKLDEECCIVSVEPQSAAGRAGLPPRGRWALTEVNNRPIDIVKGGDEEMNRLASHGTEVSLLIQPAALVKKMRAAIKASKPLLSLR
nr:flocculation protein FLO11 [Vanessa tameamea]